MQGTYPVLNYCQNNLVISDLKMATKILQGVPLLLKVCTDTLTEDNNQNYARGSPTGISFFGFFGQRDRFATRQASGISSTNRS